MSCEDRGRYWSDGSTSQGMPRTANNRSQGKAGNSFCPRATKTACHADRTSCLLNHGENKHLLLKATRFMLECYGSPTKPTEKAEGGGGRKGEWKSPRARLTGPEEGSWKLPSNRAHSALNEWDRVTPGKETFILDFPGSNSSFYYSGGNGKMLGFFKLTWTTSTMASFLQPFILFIYFFYSFVWGICPDGNMYL